jgi:hypothetical protein
VEQYILTLILSYSVGILIFGTIKVVQAQNMSQNESIVEVDQKASATVSFTLGWAQHDIVYTDISMQDSSLPQSFMH